MEGGQGHSVLTVLAHASFSSTRNASCGSAQNFQSISAVAVQLSLHCCMVGCLIMRLRTIFKKQWSNGNCYESASLGIRPASGRYILRIEPLLSTLYCRILSLVLNLETFQMRNGETTI